MTNWNRWEKFVFWCFIAWTCAGLVFSPLRLSPEVVETWSLPPPLISFVTLCLRAGDPILIVLATLNTHWLCVREWGSRRARSWAIATIIVGAIVETTGTRTGFPFGNYHYSDGFGWRIAGILPFTIPLAWFVLVSHAALIARRLMPYAQRLTVAAVAATMCTWMDYVMEPFATVIKGYWTWEGGIIPWQNYLAWWTTTFVIVTCFFPGTGIGRMGTDLRLYSIPGAILILFVITRIAYGI